MFALWILLFPSEMCCCDCETGTTASLPLLLLLQDSFPNLLPPTGSGLIDYCTQSPSVSFVMALSRHLLFRENGELDENFHEKENFIFVS